jgi:hypothetical protein
VIDGELSMRERGAMKAAVTLVLAVLIGACSIAPASAQSAAPGAEPEVRVQKPRPRTRLRVQPIYPYRNFHTIYPLPYDVEYPGPNAHRECVGGLAVEHRPSGTVIVPRERCRWMRGRYAGP